MFSAFFRRRGAAAGAAAGAGAERRRRGPRRGGGEAQGGAGRRGRWGSYQGFNFDAIIFPGWWFGIWLYFPFHIWDVILPID